MNRGKWQELKERIFRDFPNLCWFENVKMRRSMGERYGADEDPYFDEHGDSINLPWVTCDDPCAPLYEIFGLCGCGAPDDVIRRFYYPFLKAIDERREWERSHSMLDSFKRYNDMLADNMMKAMSGRRVNLTAFKVVDDQTVEYLVLYVLNDKGLTEHGTSIGGCWLTEKGKTALAICKAVFAEESKEAEA